MEKLCKLPILKAATSELLAVLPSMLCVLPGAGTVLCSPCILWQVVTGKEMFVEDSSRSWEGLCFTSSLIYAGADASLEDCWEQLLGAWWKACSALDLNDLSVSKLQL